MSDRKPQGRRKRWKVRVQEARKRGYFLSKEKTLAASWHTCSIGERRDVKISDFGAPIDPVLVGLGLGFFHSVSDDAWSDAESILKAVDIRAKELAS